MKFAKIAADRQALVNNAMVEFDVKINWLFAHRSKGNARVPVECNKCGFTVTRSVSDLQLGKFFCFGCFSKTLEDYTEKHDFKLVNFNTKQIICECKVCGDKKRVATTVIYTCSIRCNNCITHRLKSIAESKNFEYLYRVSSKLVRIKCNGCSGIKQINTSTLFSGEFSCEHCKELQRISDMSPEGFTVISPDIGSACVLVSCNVCGYWKRTTFSTIKKQSLKCIYCTKMKYERALESKNCTLLFKEGSIIHFLSPDGREMTTTQSSALSRKFTFTEDTHWNQPISLYLITTLFNGTTYCKIGTAVNPEVRMKDLKLPEGSTCVELLRFEQRWLADSFEKELHKYFEEHNVSTDVVKGFSRRVIRKNRVDGVTEWFTDDVLDMLPALIRDKKENNDNTNRSCQN